MKLVHTMAPARAGGAEQVVLDLTAALADRDVEVHLVAVLEEGTTKHPFLERDGCGIRVHPLFLPPRRYRRERREVARLVQRIGAEVVHTHGYRADVVGQSAARAADVPTVSTVHGFTGGGLRNRLYEWVQRRALRRCDAVIAVSVPMAERLKGDGVARERLHVIPNARSPVTDLLESGEARRRLGGPREAFHVGWIGRLSQEKGPDVMLEALAELGRGDSAGDLHATFIGDGRERDALIERTGDLGLDGHVRWAGEIPAAARLLSAFDVVVLSSRTEGTPIVAIEALSAGVPLVATRVGGVEALTGNDTALLVPPEDPRALADAIQAVRADPEAAAARARAGRERMGDVASVERWVDAYLEVYRRVVAGDGGRS